MKTNTKLAVVFALATGLMSSAALAMSAGASVDSSAVDIQKVQMLYNGGANPQSDNILWGGASAIKDFLSDNKGSFPAVAAVFDVPTPPPPPTDPLGFLGDRSEIRRDFAYQASFDLATLPPEAPQDHAPSLMDVYNDNPLIIRALRENPGLRDNRVLAILAAAYQTPSRDSFDPEGRVITPTDQSLAEMAATEPTKEEPVPTINSTYIFIAATSGLLSREQYSFLAKIYWTIVKYEAAGLTYPLPEAITNALIGVKDKVSGILAVCNHDAFHATDSSSPHAAAAAVFSPCHPGAT